MIISLGLDHRAVHLRDFITEHLEELEFEVLNHSADDTTPVDYPDIAKKVAKDIKTMQANFGILGCLTGIGMSIAANKFQGIRAALVHSPKDTLLAREHNDANIMCIAGSCISKEIIMPKTSNKLKELMPSKTLEKPKELMTPDLFREMLDIFFMAEFEGGRHERRLSKIVEFEFSQK